MKKFFVLFLLSFFLVGCLSDEKVEVVDAVDSLESSEFVDESSGFDLINIVAFGDSLTEGLYVETESAYPAQLERSLIDLGYEVKVFNSGFSGETSSGALDRINWVLRLNPDVVILGIGANDAIRGIDLEITERNIVEIIDRIRMKNSDIRIILSGQQIYENLGEDYISEFEGIYSKVASESGVDLIPFFLEGVAGNSSLNNPDEIHPNEKGYSIIVENNVLPVLIPVLNELR